MASPSPAPSGELKEALAQLDTQTWPVQETCYNVLVKLLENVIKNPSEVKFRSVRRENAAIKAKVLDCPGGAAVLVAAGFAEDADTYTLSPGASVDHFEAFVEHLKVHAKAQHEAHIRAVRDEKIAAAKKEEAILNEMGGFARGRHKLSSGDKDVAGGGGSASGT
eukprot:TRINITY_DN64927_c0_g1_i1.p1 TRINITY_DN64927_c0_g1~~TRINITY_DN64927_c0_g1_i1.p1  ORF type:complete len:176 (-),score=45.25 TRINITY_DN64927_c0_g1_i1:300-794(-)